MAVDSIKDVSTLPIVGAAQRSKPSQTTFIRPAQMSLFARVTSYPPLGQVTTFQRRQGQSQSTDEEPVSAWIFFAQDQ